MDASKPAKISAALDDSPVALAARIGEKLVRSSSKGRGAPRLGPTQHMGLPLVDTFLPVCLVGPVPLGVVPRQSIMSFPASLSRSRPVGTAQSRCHHAAMKIKKA
jgi:hypothetical protein